MGETTFFQWLITQMQAFGLRLLCSIIVLIAGSILIRFIIRIFPDGKKNRTLDPTVKGFVRSFMTIGMWVLLIVCVIAILGVPMASVVAAVASAGLTIGLAMQGSLSNLAGGLMLLLFRPYSVGEYIKAPTAEGTVYELGIFYTVLRTEDNKRVTIPNGTMMNNTIINYSREELRRVEIDLVLPYGADFARAEAAAARVAAENAHVLRSPEPSVRLSAAGASNQTLSVRVWVRSEDFRSVEASLLRALHDTLADEGIPPFAG